MSIGLAVEIASNFIQLFMLIGFLYLFFDKPEGTAMKVVPFAVTSAIMLAVATIFTLNNILIKTQGLREDIKKQRTRMIVTGVLGAVSWAIIVTTIIHIIRIMNGEISIM